MQPVERRAAELAGRQRLVQQSEVEEFRPGAGPRMANEAWPAMARPRRRPPSEEARAIRRSEMPPRIMISPAKMNSGMAISEAEPVPAEICCTSTIEGMSRYSRVASAAAASA